MKNRLTSRKADVPPPVVKTVPKTSQTPKPGALPRRTLLAGLASTAVLQSGCPLSISPPLPGTPLANTDAEKASVVDETALLKRVSETLQQERRYRGLSTMSNGAWQIFHGVLAFGEQFEIDTPSGRTPALQYFLDGGSCDGFRPRPGNQIPVANNESRTGLYVDIQPSTKVGQGHRDQWLAVVAQAGLSLDAEWKVENRTFTVSDWLRQALFDIPLNYAEEFSWTIIPLVTYQPTSYEWTSRDGNTYNTELLLEVECLKDLQASVCGGTHRLIGIAFAVRKRLAEKQPMTGVWATAKTRLDNAIELARTNQNPDGTYSTAYMHRTGWCQDLGETLGTTGHVLEFLALAADDETLRSDWVRRTADRLCEVLELCRGVDLECGVLYHALHGLVEYRRRLTV